MVVQIQLHVIYNLLATCDDGSCNTVYGCTDPTACNYDASATCDDGLCIGIAGVWILPLVIMMAPLLVMIVVVLILAVLIHMLVIMILLQVAIMDPVMETGCNDPTAINYDPTADCSMVLVLFLVAQI